MIQTLQWNHPFRTESGFYTAESRGKGANCLCVCTSRKANCHSRRSSQVSLNSLRLFCLVGLATTNLKNLETPSGRLALNWWDLHCVVITNCHDDSLLVRQMKCVETKGCDNGFSSHTMASVTTCASWQHVTKPGSALSGYSMAMGARTDLIGSWSFIEPRSACSLFIH